MRWCISAIGVMKLLLFQMKFTFVCLFVCLFVFMFVCLFFWCCFKWNSPLSVCSSICWSVCLFIYLSCLSVCLLFPIKFTFVYLSVCLSVCCCFNKFTFVCLSVWLSFFSTNLFVCFCFQWIHLCLLPSSTLSYFPIFSEIHLNDVIKTFWLWLTKDVNCCVNNWHPHNHHHWLLLCFSDSFKSRFNSYSELHCVRSWPINDLKQIAFFIDRFRLMELHNKTISIEM